MFKNRTMRNPTRHACVQRAVSHRSHQASILWIRNLSDLEDLDHEIIEWGLSDLFDEWTFRAVSVLVRCSQGDVSVWHEGVLGDNFLNCFFRR